MLLENIILRKKQHRSFTKYLILILIFGISGIQTHDYQLAVCIENITPKYTIDDEIIYQFL